MNLSMTKIYMNDVDGGVSVICTDPLVNQNPIVEQPQVDDQLHPIKVLLSPRRVQHGPATQRSEQLLERLVSS